MSSPQRLSRPFRARNSFRKRARGGDEGGQKHGKTATAGREAGERRRRGRPSTGDSRFLIGICPILSGFLLGPSNRYFLAPGI